MSPTAATTATATAATTNGSRLLIIGATGFIGKFVAEASVLAGLTTYLLVRPGSTTPFKANIIKKLQEKGAVVIHGSMSDRELIEKTLKEKEIDTVISIAGGIDLLDQIPLVEAINSVKTVKRFVPSEFGHDVDRADPVEPGLSLYNEKRKVRRLIEKYQIPYTYMCTNSIAAWPYYNQYHPADVLPPTTHLDIYGDGNVKAYFIGGEDIGKFTVKAALDTRTVNKIVHFRPASHWYTISELGSLWEKKLGRTLPRVTITEQRLLDIAAENIRPPSVVAAITLDIFITGCQNFKADREDDAEIHELYPHDTFRSLEDCFEDYVPLVKDQIKATTNDVEDDLPKESVPNAVPIASVS